MQLVECDPKSPQIKTASMIHAILAHGQERNLFGGCFSALNPWSECFRLGASTLRCAQFVPAWPAIGNCGVSHKVSCRSEGSSHRPDPHCRLDADTAKENRVRQMARQLYAMKAVGLPDSLSRNSRKGEGHTALDGLQWQFTCAEVAAKSRLSALVLRWTSCIMTA